ncbi:MAG: hypothetical protein IMY71_12530 [Bacteroidetes bacterium]|nr:hypothetical protein [Bacteroidota bacterium]
MAIIDLLASSQGLRGNEANIALAKEIASSGNKSAIKELVENLQNKDKKIQGDCIKTLYETGYLKPDLIAEYYNDFLQLLTSKNNYLVWSGMIAIAVITDLKPKEIFASLDLIMQIVNNGSVITIDNGVEILAKLNKFKEYFNTTDPLLMEQLWKCPIKQLPMYAEKSLISINKRNKETYQNIIGKRKDECEKDSQIKRLKKVLKRIDKI